EVYKRIIRCYIKYALLQNNFDLLSELYDHESLLNSYWSKVTSVQRIANERFVYDFAVKENETFLAGFGGLFIHNTFTMANVIQNVQKPTLVISHNKT